MNSGNFKPGGLPWNKGMKGIHHSPATEWKKGRASEKKLPVGTLRIRQRKKEKHPRAWIKIADPRTWIPHAQYVWEQAFGPIPKGMVIHHRDRNPLNDDLSNLEILTRSEHAAEHNHELHGARYGAGEEVTGTGSTGVAAIKAGKTFTGIEHNPKHFETAVRRVSEAYQRLIYQNSALTEASTSSEPAEL